MGMAQGRLSILLRQMIRSAKSSGAGVTDTQLLDRFVTQRDEAAFELLVWRHQRMVLSLCRRILPCEQDAEDAFQATFLALACKAGSIGKREAVASWLFKVAYRIACRERANGEKRSRHAQRVANWRDEQCPAAATEALESDVRTVIHEEINSLPESYRASVILCYLEGKTNEEAALQMSCPTGTVVTWLARARRRLRSRLARRGVTLSSGCLLTALAARDSLAGPPPTFVDQTVRAALIFAADQSAPGLVSAKVAALTRGVLEAMMMTKLKLVIAVLLLIAFVSTGSGVLAYCNLPEDEHFGRPTGGSAISVVRWEEPQTDKPADPIKTKPDLQATKDSKQKKDGAKNHTAKEVVSQSFKVGKSPKIIVDLHNGAIEVEATAETTVEASVTKQGKGKTEEIAKEALKKIEVKMTQEGDTVRIQEIRKEDVPSSEYSASATAALKVPAGATLELHTKNGAVTINGGTGKIQVQTSNGSITASKAKGAIELRTSNGQIVVKDAAGPIDVKTHNGEIEIQGENGLVKAETLNGSVHFKGSLAKGEHSLRTSNGEITVALPSDASFRLDAETTHGRIKNEFSTDSAAGKGKTQLRSTVGQNPVVDIRLRTTNGSITLRRQETKK
jgi:RNA polymerase sigma factor (sigma-70 family)